MTADLYAVALRKGGMIHKVTAPQLYEAGVREFGLIHLTIPIAFECHADTEHGAYIFGSTLNLAGAYCETCFSKGNDNDRTQSRGPDSGS